MAQQINLFNPVFLKQKKHFSAVTMLQALALLLGGILAFYGYALHESRTLAKVAADTERQLKAQGEQVGRLTKEFSPQGRSTMLADEIARTGVRLKQREEMLSLLRTGGLGNTDGFARYLSAFARQTMGGVWLTGFTIGGDEAVLQVTGRVLQPDLVPAYIRALNREEVMRGRRVSELRLTGREERDAPGTTAPGAAPAAAQAPRRFVEFSMSAVRGNATAGAAEPAPAKVETPAKEVTK